MVCAPMISKIVEKMRCQLDDWHNAGLDFFPMDTTGWGADPESVEGQVYRLAYNNYENWHTEELVLTIADSVTAITRYRQGLRFNRDRNAAMEKLDQIMCGLQKETGEWHSETLSSIFDRISVLHLKKLHALTEAPQKVALLKQQANFLAEYAHRLHEDIIAGRRRCLFFTRLKLFNTFAQGEDAL